MTPEVFAEKSRKYPVKSCVRCGARMLPRVWVDSRTGWEGLEQLSKFTTRKYCGRECTRLARRTAGDEHVVRSPHVKRAISEWRSIHGFEWPYQASPLAQDHYLELLAEYREAA